MKNILSFINTYRHKSSNFVFINEFILSSSIFSILLILILYIEKTFYLSMGNRKLYFIFYISFLFIIYFYSLIKWAISYFSLFNNNTDEDISKKLSFNFLDIKDRLLNIIQLNKISPELDLTQLAIKNMGEHLNSIKLSDHHFQINKNRLYLLVSFIFISIFIIYFNLKDPLFRLVNYNKHYSPPLPFVIETEKTEYKVLSGDTLEIFFNGEGLLPDSINLKWIEIKKQYTQKIPKINDNYYHSFNNIRSDISFWVTVKPESWISSWDSIGTIPADISVKERPKIIESNFKITSPEYTESNTKIMKGSNSNQIEILEGSKIELDFIANKKLIEAWALLGDERIDLNTNNNNISGNLFFKENTILSVYCLDENYIPNLNPTQYTLLKIQDNPPLQSIYLPFNEFQINESYEILINMNVIDDYGIKDIYIEYEIISPEYFTSNISNGKWQLLDTENENIKNININKTLDISSLDLSMGDELHFWFISKDYLNISKSNKFVGKFPTLEDMFNKIEEYEEENNEWVDDIQESLNEIFETANDAKLDLIKDKDLSIEKEKNIEKSIEEVNNIIEEIEKVQENIEKIQEHAEKNNLFDENLMKKFDHFQNILQDMMTPELMESINKLQEAMQNLDQKELLSALENFEFNVEQFEAELDRFIEMFELAQAEQKLNELEQSIQNMIDKQNSLTDQINNQPEKNKMLTSKSHKQEKRFEDFKNILDETNNIMDSSSEKISNDINELIDNAIMSETKNNLNKTTQQLSENNLNQAEKKSEETKNNLEKISEQINQIKENFKDETVQKLSKEFILIIENLLTISNQQEKIINNSKSLKSNSPNLKDINSNQNNINRELNQVMKAMLNLSNKTFFMKPAIGRSFGKIKKSISSAISNFEQRKISPAKKSQVSAIDNINETIYLLLDALNEMQNSEQASGFEQFMESLESISQKQKGINQGTMQLSQFGMMQQQSLMEQLQSQQQKLKEELSDLLGEFPGENNGTMEKITNDMDNVIQDFSNKNITQKTIDRQQEIISRMLDNQKSLAQRDFSDQRKSKSGDQFEYTGSKLLPNDLGQNNILLINAMEAAMNEGHSNEYNQLIRSYFYNLQKKINEN